MVVGDDRNYVAALLTLDIEILNALAPKLGLEDTNPSALATNPVVAGMVKQAVEAANEKVSRPEQVKAYEILPVEWTAESEELTPTLKLKRRVITKAYAERSDRLYQ